MKRQLGMALGSALLLSLSTALAQEPPPAPPLAPLPSLAPPALDEPPPVLAKAGRRSTARMIAGIVITSFGAAMLVGATGTLASIHPCKPQCDDDLDTLVKVLIGSVLGGVGVVHVSVGVPLWVSGAKPAEPGAASRNALLAAPPVAPTAGSGLTLRWSF